MAIAGKICIYTNDNVIYEELRLNGHLSSRPGRPKTSRCWTS